jgi:ATP:ADP antiporter, AAA family
VIKALLRFLGGDEGEEKQMLLLLGKGFFMGILIASYDVGATSLFVNDIGESRLDEAFFYTGLAGIVFTSVFVYFQRKINFSTLVNGMTFLVLLVIVGMRLAFHVNDYQINDMYLSLVFGMFILMGPINAVVLLGFWGIFGRIFDLKQSKRIIGGIDTGQLFATLIAFFSIPLLARIKVINETHDLMTAASIAAFGVFVFTVLLSVSFHLDKVTKAHRKVDAKEKVRFIDLLKNPYLRMLSLFLIFSMGASVFADYLFLSATETFFTINEVKQEAELRDFLSFFGGTIIIVSFLIQSFINDFIIGRFGLKIALMTMPFILGGFTIGAIISGHVFEYAVRTEEFILFFLFTASAKLFTDSLKDALENPAFKLFFLPIDVKIRFDIQTRIEGVVNEFAKLVAGAAQMGLGLLAFFQLIHYSYFILALSGIVIWLSAKVFAEYKLTLRQTLERQKKQLEDEGKRNEHNTINLLKSELKLRDADRVIQALKILEKLDPIEFEFALLDLLNSRQAFIRKHSYEKLEEHLCFGALEIIEREAQTEGDDMVLPAMKSCLAALREANKFELTDVNIRKLVRSTEAEDRTKAAHLLIKATEDRHVAFLVELLRDINPAVRSAAMVTAGKVRRPELWSILVENLHLATYSNVAMASLRAAGEPVFHTIDSAFYKTGQYLPTTIRIVQLMGRIGGRQAVELLWKKIDYPNKKVVSELLLSLSYLGFQAKDFQSARLRLMIEAEIGDLAWNARTVQEIPHHNEIDQLILRAFHEEDKHNYENIFMLLAMVYDAQNVKLVKDNIDIGTTESISFAVEMLDIFVHEGLKPKIFPVMDELKVEDKLARLQNFYPPEYFNDYEDLLKQIMNRDYNRLNRYTKALAIWRISQMSKEVTMDLIANLFNPDPLILQTSAYAIYKIDKQKYLDNTRRLKSFTKKELDKAILPPVFRDEEEDYHQKLLLIERVLLLKSMGVFSEIPGIQITYLAEAMDEIKVRPQTKLIEQGEGGNAPMYIVLDGVVGLYENDQRIGEVRAQGIFGEKLLLDSDRFEFTAVAENDCKLLVLRKEELQDLLSLHMEIVEAFLKILREGAESIEHTETADLFM